MMETVAYILLGFALLRLLVALVNLVFRQSLLEADTSNDLVSVIVPVRNEAENLEPLLLDLQKQTQRNFEIRIFDDQSTDQTASIVRQFAENDSRISLLHSNNLPSGWLGKNHACHHASLGATGKWLLFLDADVRLKPDALALAVGRLKKQRLGLLSIFPRQTMLTLGEQLTVPVINQILLSLLPLILVRKSRMTAFSGANGQFMLFDGALYRAVKPHERFRGEKVEDLKIARYLKRQKVRIAFLASETKVSCRMYGGYNEAINGFSKNLIQIFGGSALLASLYWLSTTIGFLPVLLALGFNSFLLYVVLSVLTRMLVSITSHQSCTKNFGNSIFQQLLLGWMILQAIWLNHQKKLIWKDRNISI